MQLKRIKIAGFKSFADPVTIHVPRSLSGIVGPNGSGKSNIIDAMRWAAGESSAKSLRGDTLDDIIFNGSAQRKPAGRASVELLFDNTLSRCPGQWSKYAEISIRRTATRDGISEYFINGTRTRRRDVRELFLGTGFGPRSYSIIEQGMISRIVEAKPEELSSFIEEASGVSRFREKRHETLLKLNRTQDNLERLDDMRAEVAQRLRQLKYQADQARRYRKLKERADALRARLLAVQWGGLRERMASIETSMLELDVEKQKRLSLVRSAEADLESARKGQLELQTKVNQLQMEHYRVNAEISNLDRQIKESREAMENARHNLGIKNEEIAQMEESILDLQQKEKSSSVEFDRLQTLIHEVSDTLKQQQEVLAKSEQELEASQNNLEQIDQQVVDAIRRREVALAGLEESQRRQSAADSTIAELESELRQVESTIEIDLTEPLQLRITELSGVTEKLKSEIEQAESSLSGKRIQGDQFVDELERMRDDAQEAQVKLKTLERSLSEFDENEAAVQWMMDIGSGNGHRISSKVSVQEGWERAIDRVLGDKLSAVVVDNIEQVVSRINGDSFPSRMYFVDGSRLSCGSKDKPSSLANFVNSEGEVVESMLAGAYAANSLADALSMRPNLSENECVVTAEGAMLGPNWFSPAINDEASTGVLETVNLVRKFRKQVEQTEECQQQKRHQIAENRETVTQLESRLMQLRVQLAESSGLVASVREELGELHSCAIRSVERLEHVRSQIQQLSDINDKAKAKQQELAQQAEIETEAYNAIERQKLEQSQQFRLRQNALKVSQDSVNELVAVRHQFELEAQKHKSDQELFRTSLGDLRRRLVRIQEERAQLQEKMSSTDDPTAELKQKLEQYVVESRICEEKLSKARSEADDSEMSYKKLDEQRLQHQLSVEEINNRLQDQKVEIGKLTVQAKETAQKVEDLDFSPDNELSAVDEEFDYEAGTQQLEKLLRRIDNTGAINLIAVEQFEQECQRKEYMDSQYDDLTRAVGTLRSTIARIDNESREQYIETFSMVNSEYQRLLPLLFGGGSGHLELIGEYPEDSGLRIFARPKGKRIHNIQSLSGGEKALTAVALLLSFFHLNPSPVCLLDEIDAPLDDDNVYRLCDSLRNLADSTQLILITHNKITMESVDSLIGVTMPEPNVSRILSVDLQEAQEYAA